MIDDHKWNINCWAKVAFERFALGNTRKRQ